jgi:purine catabolism regulator
MDASAARITVAAALELPALRRGLPEVVAGAEALDRPIRWVHAGEVRNIASLLRGGELLLTTGMAIGPTASDQRTFVAELAAREVAALAIELGNTYNNRLPAALVAAAERHGLPLIELHAAVPFVAVTEAIHTEIVNRQYDLLRRAEGLQERFTQLMLQGGGIPGVLALLAEALANPVFLEAADGRLLYHASATGEDPVGAWAQAARGGSALAVAAAVPGAGQLVALPVDAPLDGAFARLAVERAAGIVALALLRTRQEDELLARGRGDLLADLAAGRIAPEPAAARAAAMGFAGRATDALLPIVARADAPWPTPLRELEREQALIGVDPGDGALLMVLVLRDADERERAAGRVARALPRAVVAVAGTTGWDGVGQGLRDAAESAAAVTDATPRPWHDATRMALDRLLWRWRDQPDLTAYVDRMLGAVLAHDAKRKHQLLPTLEALCLHGGRKAETARALHLNRQALYDRITRLEQVLDADLSDARTLLALHVALEARRHGSSHPN